VSPLIGPITEAYSRRPRGGVVTPDAAEKGKVGRPDRLRGPPDDATAEALDRMGSV